MLGTVVFWNMVDWGAGKYETTAIELEPVALVVVEQAAVSVGEDVLDLACGTGNAALLASDRGASVVGVDAAPRLLDVARSRARTLGVDLDLRVGDLLDLPVDDSSVDVVISVFGVIFAADPAQALREIVRVLRPDGRVLLSAWVPAGPIHTMLGAMGQIMSRVGGAPPRGVGLTWSDADALGALAAEAGLSLQTTTPGELAIAAASPEAYVVAGQEHPMALAARRAVQPELHAEMERAITAVLHAANEDAEAFLVHSPYVVHALGHRHGARTVPQ